MGDLPIYLYHCVCCLPPVTWVVGHQHQPGPNNSLLKGQNNNVYHVSLPSFLTLFRESASSYFKSTFTQPIQVKIQKQTNHMYDGQEDLDNVVWDKNDDDWDEALKRMRLKTTCRQVERLASECFGKPAVLVPPLIVGGFNVLYRLRCEGDTSDFILRLPGQSVVQFPDEKTFQEAATARYVAKKHSASHSQAQFLRQRCHAWTLHHHGVYPKLWQHVSSVDCAC